MSIKINEIQGKEVSLREEKFAFTRLSILKATMQQLKKVSLEALDIELICCDLKISRRTFFNYFPQKSYIMQFLLSIWVYEISLEFEKVKKKKQGIDLIFEFVSLFDKKLKENTNISKELISQLFNLKLIDLDHIPPLNKTEKQMLGLTDDLELTSPYSLNPIMEYAISQAISSCQLPKETSVNDFCMLIQSLILGTLQVIVFNNIDLESTDYFKSIVSRQLGVYIKGLNVR